MGKTKKVINATVQSNRFIVNTVLPVKVNEKYTNFAYLCLI